MEIQNPQQRNHEVHDRAQDYRRRFQQIGVGASALGVVALVLLVVGLFQGWLNIRGVSTDTKESTELGVAVTIDTEEIAEDANAVEQAAEAIAELVSVKGNVVEVDPRTPALTMKLDSDESLKILIEDSTEILSTEDKEVTLEYFTPNDEIIVVYKTKEGDVKIAQKIKKLEAK